MTHKTTGLIVAICLSVSAVAWAAPCDKLLEQKFRDELSAIKKGKMIIGIPAVEIAKKPQVAHCPQVEIRIGFGNLVEDDHVAKLLLDAEAAAAQLVADQIIQRAMSNSLSQEYWEKWYPYFVGQWWYTFITGDDIVPAYLRDEGLKIIANDLGWTFDRVPTSLYIIVTPEGKLADQQTTPPAVANFIRKHLYGAEPLPRKLPQQKGATQPNGI